MAQSQILEQRHVEKITLSDDDEALLMALFMESSSGLKSGQNVLGLDLMDAGFLSIFRFSTSSRHLQPD